MPEVVIVGDTHIPSRASSIPDWIADLLEGADHAIHTGDFDDPDALQRVRHLAGGDLTAVSGNMDPSAVDLPEVATLDVENVRFVVTHGTGSPRGWADRVAGTVQEHADPDRTNVGVAGHTHEVTDRVYDGVRILNPGSATGALPADGETALVVEVAGDEIDVEVRRG